VRIYGIITDANTGEALPGANVYKSNQVGTPIKPIQGTSTNDRGEFYGYLTNGSFMTIKFIGYEPMTVPISPSFTIYELRPVAYDLPKVTVTPKTIFATATFGVLAVLYFLFTLKK
jgi:hypothetical protein